ncbi:unnamed protein product [Withania somnifera]
MAPATLRMLCYTLFFAILSIQKYGIRAYSPESSPSPSPESGGDLSSLSPIETPSPSPSPLAPNMNSPPSPPTADYSPSSDPAPSPVDGGNVTPAPAPASVPAPSEVVASDVSHESTTSELNDESSSDGGMSGGKKAGVAIGVITAACVVFLGGLVYKKRRQNIRRAQFGYVAKRDWL